MGDFSKAMAVYTWHEMKDVLHACRSRNGNYRM